MVHANKILAYQSTNLQFSTSKVLTETGDDGKPCRSHSCHFDSENETPKTSDLENDILPLIKDGLSNRCFIF